MWKSPRIFALILLATAGLMGCDAEIDPKNPGPATDQAISRYMRKIGGRSHAWKRVIYRDLNQDGHREAIVLTNDPKLCVPEGCPLLIFENKNKRYKFLSKIDQVKSIRAESKVINGWKSLVVTSGDQDEQIYILPFDNGYPAEASLGEPYAGRFHNTADQS